MRKTKYFIYKITDLKTGGAFIGFCYITAKNHLPLTRRVSMDLDSILSSTNITEDEKEGIKAVMKFRLIRNKSTIEKKMEKAMGYNTSRMVPNPIDFLLFDKDCIETSILNLQDTSFEVLEEGEGYIYLDPYGLCIFKWEDKYELGMNIGCQESGPYLVGDIMDYDISKNKFFKTEEKYDDLNYSRRSKILDSMKKDIDKIKYDTTKLWVRVDKLIKEHRTMHPNGYNGFEIEYFNVNTALKASHYFNL
jgi:hypothetical protein